VHDPFAAAPRDLIDLSRYRLDDPANRAVLVADAKRGLAASSCVVLLGFVQGDAIRRMAAEAMRARPRAWRRDDAMTPYGPPVEGLPAGDPRAIATPLAMRTLAGDDFEASSDIVRLYRWDGLTRFIAEVMDETELHRVFDPLFGCNVTILDEGPTSGAPSRRTMRRSPRCCAAGAIA
jgi:hypothetical protein